MDISTKKIKEWFKNNYPTLVALGALLTILNFTGFNINIPEYYNNLDAEGKTIFLAFTNFLICIVLFFYLLGRINSLKKK